MRFAGTSSLPFDTGGPVDELESYLKEPVVANIGDVLDWWSVKAKTHPRLARMARDILSIPSTC